MKKNILIVILSVLIILLFLFPVSWFRYKDYSLSRSRDIGRLVVNNLEQYKSACGRYPTTTETLEILRSGCGGNYTPQWGPDKKFVDVYGAPFMYFSDGNSFQLLQFDGFLQIWQPNDHKIQQFPQDFVKE